MWFTLRHPTPPPSHPRHLYFWNLSTGSQNYWPPGQKGFSNALHQVHINHGDQMHHANLRDFWKTSFCICSIFSAICFIHKHTNEIWLCVCEVGIVDKISDYQPEGSGFNPWPGWGSNFGWPLVFSSHCPWAGMWSCWSSISMFCWGT